MSQGGPSRSLNNSGGMAINTLTGNSGGAVGPNASNNINLVGNTGTGINIVGNAGTNTLTVINTLTLTGNSGGAISPAFANWNILGGTGITVAGVGSTLTITASGGAFVETINGDVGSATGTTITFNGQPQAGSSVSFSASGSTVLLNTTDSNNNTIIGKGAGNLTLVATACVAIGQGALSAVTTGSDNVAIGLGAGRSLQGGQQNTVVGYSALGSGVNNSYNAALGINALNSCTSDQNVGIGYLGGAGITSGGGNIAIGAYSMSTGPCSVGNNVCIGVSSGISLSTGQNNVGIGYNALGVATTDPNNIAIGASVLTTLKGSLGHNIAIGNGALTNLVTGTQNTALGDLAGNSLTTSDSNNIIIGHNGIAGDNNRIRIGTSGTHTSCFIQGIQGVAVSNPNFVTINTSTGQLGSVSSSGGGLIWTDVTGATQTVVAGNGYLADRGGGVAFTLPASSTIGDVFRIAGVQGSWTLAQAANQQIKFGNQATTLGATGSLASAAANDSVELVASNTSASSVWVVISSVGNISVA